MTNDQVTMTNGSLLEAKDLWRATIGAAKRFTHCPG
jgi:hypothetical protein